MVYMMACWFVYPIFSTFHDFFNDFSPIAKCCQICQIYTICTILSEEYYCNTILHLSSSKSARIFYVQGFVMTGGFYGNLISPLCIPFGLLVKPTMSRNENKHGNIHVNSNINGNKNGDICNNSSHEDTSHDMEVVERLLCPNDEISVDSRLQSYGHDNIASAASLSTEGEMEGSLMDSDKQHVQNQRRQQIGQEQEQLRQEKDENFIRLGKRKAQSLQGADVNKDARDNLCQMSESQCLKIMPEVTSSSSSSSGSCREEVVREGVILENPWLLRALILSERIEDGKSDAVTVNEAVLYSHAFGLENAFDSGALNVTVSEFIKIDGEEAGDDENDPQEERDPEFDIDPFSLGDIESRPRQQARLELSIPIAYSDNFLDMKSAISAHGPHDTIHKSLCRVHQGNYCRHLNRLHFEFKFLPIQTANEKNSVESQDFIVTPLGYVTTALADENEEVEIWMGEKIRAAGAGGISLDFLKEVYDEESSDVRSGSGRSSGSSSGRTLPARTEVELLAIGEMLAKKKKIIMDSGSGFNEIKLKCIETTEKHPVHFVDVAFSDLYVLKTSPGIYPEEGSCPWLTVAGNRNELFYRMLRSKVASILSQRPGSSLAAIHAAFPQMTLDQTNILLSTMAKEKFVFAQIAASSCVLSSPFQKISTTTPTVGYFLRL